MWRWHMPMRPQASPKAEAKKMFLDLERKAKTSPLRHIRWLLSMLRPQRKRKAFEFLEKAFSEKFWGLPSVLKSDPALDGLRSDPRFQSLRCALVETRIHRAFLSIAGGPDEPAVASYLGTVHLSFGTKPLDVSIRSNSSVELPAGG